MIDLDPADRAMLDEALKKARHLVVELEKQKNETDGSPRPAHIDPEKYEQGRHAMIKAIASARRMFASLEDAEHLANTPDDPADDSDKDA